jgi:hypothetical protein
LKAQEPVKNRLGSSDEEKIIYNLTSFKQKSVFDALLLNGLIIFFYTMITTVPLEGGWGTLY